MRITPIAAAIASATGLTASLLLASPAQASPASTSTPASETKVVSPAPSSCKKGYACGWRHKNYSTDLVSFQWSISDYALLSLWGKEDNMTSSVYNNGTTLRAVFWQYKNYGGPSISLALQNGDRNLADANGTVPKVFNDRISSAKFLK